MHGTADPRTATAGVNNPWRAAPLLMFTYLQRRHGRRRDSASGETRKSRNRYEKERPANDEMDGICHGTGAWGDCEHRVFAAAVAILRWGSIGRVCRADRGSRAFAPSIC